MSSSDYNFEVKPRFIVKLDEFPKDVLEFSDKIPNIDGKPCFPVDVQDRIKDKLEEFKQKVNTYGIDPREHNNTKYIAKDKVWRLRVGDYRVFFDIYDRTISILFVEHRKKAYK